MSKKAETNATVMEYFFNGGGFVYNHCQQDSSMRWATVNIGFSHSENPEDETQFDIHICNVTELDDLFNDFVSENHFTDVNILYVTVINTALTYDGLAENE